MFHTSSHSVRTKTSHTLLGLDSGAHVAAVAFPRLNIETSHTLVGLGGAALAAAVALPR